MTPMLFRVLLLAAMVAASPAVRPPAETPAGTIAHLGPVASRHLAHARDVWVYLPPGYAASPERRYPVLYVHDGNNAFDPKRAFLGRAWEIDDACDRLIAERAMAPVIVVAVANTPARFSEYAWVEGVWNGQPVKPTGPAYARFLVDELKPRIDQTYRTRPDRGSTGVMGSSMGGLISLYLGRYHGDTFGRIGAVSPALGWGKKEAIAEAARMPRGLRIWLDMGTVEGRTLDLFKDSLQEVRAFRAGLLTRGYADWVNLGYREVAGADHNEAAWAARTPDILRFLFPPR